MQAEQLRGAFRIAVGKGKELWGRVTLDGSLEAQGKVEQLAGEAAIACMRLRLAKAHRPAEIAMRV